MSIDGAGAKFSVIWGIDLDERLSIKRPFSASHVASISPPPMASGWLLLKMSMVSSRQMHGFHSLKGVLTSPMLSTGGAKGTGVRSPKGSKLPFWSVVFSVLSRLAVNRSSPPLPGWKSESKTTVRPSLKMLPEYLARIIHKASQKKRAAGIVLLSID